MKLVPLFLPNKILAVIPIFIISLIIFSGSKSVHANECPHTNFMVIDGKCINLDPQMKTPKKSKTSDSTNPLSELDDLTGSSIATYASLLSLVGGSTAAYKFLVRK